MPDNPSPVRKKPRKLRDDGLVTLNRALSELHEGRAFERPLTPMERCVAAVAATSPTLHLTISSRLGHSEFMKAFAALKKRHQRNRSGKPLIYVGTVAQGYGDGGSHAHLLLWNFIYGWWLRGHAKAVGLGTARITKLPPIPSDSYWTPESWIKIAYVFGQHEPVFNNDAHFKHKDRQKSKHHIIKPSEVTLQKYKPELSAALNMAKDPDIADDQLILAVHNFIRHMGAGSSGN